MQLPQGKRMGLSQGSLFDQSVVITLADATHQPRELSDSLERMLLPDEKLRYRRMRNSTARNGFALGRVLLRRSLSTFLGWTPELLSFDIGVFGKPSLRGHHSWLQFNLSNTHAAAACVLSSAPCGIDIERVRYYPDANELGQGVLSSDELEDLQRCASLEEKSRRFLEHWTLKEAFGKCLGTGLALPLAEHSLLEPDGFLALDQPVPAAAAAETLSLMNWTYGDLVLSVCWGLPATQIAAHMWLWSEANSFKCLAHTPTRVITRQIKYPPRITVGEACDAQNIAVNSERFGG
jgi:phosphopantetheinyl transferase